ncbi:hypothetical protein BKA81DRAFT_42103 [Phyllosticta paracitricarpa]|uniref:Uncharacterized protein n=1 Tax=Phyllosticta paracitricarpa TaxID=2016321 RepID=A0ABR1NIT9_9PEZI
MTGARDSGGLFSAIGVNDGLAAPCLYARNGCITVVRESLTPDTPNFHHPVYRPRPANSAAVLLALDASDWIRKQWSLHAPIARNNHVLLTASRTVSERLELSIHTWEAAQRSAAQRTVRSHGNPLVPALSARRGKKTVAVSFLFVFAFFSERAPRYRTGSPTEGDRPPARPSRKFPTGARLHTQRTALLMPGVWLEPVQI